MQPADVLLGCLILLASVASTGLLFAGALYLRKRRRSGARLMTAGLSLDLALFTLALLVGIASAAAQQPGDAPADPAAAPGGPGAAILCVLPLASGVFELVGLIWLLNRGRSLPLR